MRHKPGLPLLKTQLNNQNKKNTLENRTIAVNLGTSTS